MIVVTTLCWAQPFKYFSIDCAYPYFVVCKKTPEGHWKEHVYVICQDTESIPRIHFGFPSCVSLDTRTNYTATALRDEIQKKKTVLNSKRFVLFKECKRLCYSSWYTENYLVQVPAMTLMEFTKTYGNQLQFKEEYGPLKIVDYETIFRTECAPILGAYSYEPLKAGFRKKLIGYFQGDLFQELEIEKELFITLLSKLIDVYLTKYKIVLENYWPRLTKEDLISISVDLKGEQRGLQAVDIDQLMIGLPVYIRNKIILSGLRRECYPEDEQGNGESLRILKDLVMNYLRELTIKVCVSQKKPDHFVLMLVRDIAEVQGSRYAFNQENKVLETYNGPAHIASNVSGACVEQVHKVSFSL